MTFVADYMGAGIPVLGGGSVHPGSENPLVLAFLDLLHLSTSKHTLCFVFSVVLPSQQESATVVNAFPKSIHFDKKVGTFKTSFFFSFFLIIRLFFVFVFVLILINTIYIFFPVSRAHKRTVQTQVFTNQGRGVNSVAHK